MKARLVPILAGVVIGALIANAEYGVLSQYPVFSQINSYFNS